MKAAIKKETKKAVKCRDEGETEKAAEHMKIILKLKKALHKQEKKELKAQIKEETHLAVTHRDAGETEVATQHLKNVQRLKKELQALEDQHENASSSSPPPSSSSGETASLSADEVRLAELKKELKATAKRAQEMQEAGQMEAAEEMGKLKEIQAQIKAVKASIKAAAGPDPEEVAAAEAAAAAAAAAEAEAKAAKEAEEAKAAEAAAAAKAAAEAEEDDDPFRITDDMSEEEKMMRRDAKAAAEAKAAREAEMRAMMSAARKTKVEEASTVQQVDENEASWIRQQKKAFLAWVNSVLAEVGLHVERDITKAFDDGLFLIPLAEILTEDTVAGSHEKKPRFRIHKISNITLALDLFRKHGFRGNYSAENFADGIRELVLGFVYTLGVTYIGGDDARKSNSADDLLKWVQGHVNDKPAYDGVHVANFTESFKDGRAFAALLNALDPTYLDYAPGEPVQTHNDAYDAAKSILEVPKLLDAQAMVEEPDDKAVKMYLMLIRAAHDRRAKAAAERDAFAASLRERLEAMETPDLWRLYDGLCFHEGDCPECMCDLTPYFIFDRLPARQTVIKPLVDL